jgi:exoribonuclease-2
MALQGAIIEYLDNGRFLCGFVTAESGTRLHIQNQNGRDVNLPANRVVHQSAQRLAVDLPREAIIGKLQATAERRQEMMAAINLEELWHLTVAETDTDFSLRFLTELCFGKESSDDHIAAFLRAVFQDRLYFKYRDGRIICHPVETVEQLRCRLQKEQENANLLEEGALGLRRIWESGDAGDWPGKDACLAIIKDYYLFGNEAPESESARELLKRARLSAPDDAFHLLVKAGIWENDENIPLLRNGIARDFTAAALEEIKSLSEPDLGTLLHEGRRDLTALPLITIDGKMTRDFDDALHIERRDENYLVGIHVTDVARFIKPGGILFAEALARGTSIYFPEGQVPMLPPSLSEGILSLILEKPRAAISFLALLSPTAEVLDFTLVPSVVRVRRQLHYAEVDQAIDTDEELAPLSRLSVKLRKRRLENGAIILPFPDVNILLGTAGLINVTLSDSDSPSRILVSEFMILANTLAAQFLTDREVPGLFRSQPAPRKRLVDGYSTDLFLNIRQRKQLSPMNLSVKANPHSSLGVAQYTTVTSPIRRILDLIMQHQMLALIGRNSPLFSKHELKTYAGVITDRISRVNTTKNLRHRYWLLKYLQSQQGRKIQGLIVDKGPRRVHVLLPGLMLDTDLPASQAADISLGDSIQVRLAKVDALNNVLRIER